MQPNSFSKLLENIDASPDVEDAHDPARTRLGQSLPPRRDAGHADSGRLASVPKDDIAADAINPSHYRKHPSGIECIEVTRHMNFNIGNAIKYIWRHMDKGDPVENLKKAQWYLDDEIRRIEGLR